MKIFSNNQLSVKEIWLSSFRLYSKTLSAVWPIAVIIGAMIVAMALMDNSAACQLKALDFKNITKMQMICFSLHLVALLFMIYLGGVILHRMYMLGNNEDTGLYMSLTVVGKKYFQIASSMLFIFLVCVLGTLAFIAPGVFLFVLFVMVQPLILFDNKGWYAAFKNSCELVWGNWWRTFAVVFPVLAFNYLISFIAQLAVGSNYWWLIIIGTSVVTAFIYPLFHSCVLMQFNDLKLRRKK